MLFLLIHFIGICLSFLILRVFYKVTGYSWDADKRAFYIPVIGLGIFATQGIVLWILYYITQRIIDRLYSWLRENP